MDSRKRIFSGVQPSGNLHIGNYLGAIANWVKLQDEYESIFCVVDMHAITVPQDPETLRKKTIEIAKIYLASGIDPKKSSIFIQSQVAEHAELMWILNTITKMSELEKMTQFKDKAKLDHDLLKNAFDKIKNSASRFTDGESKFSEFKNFIVEFEESIKRITTSSAHEQVALLKDRLTHYVIKSGGLIEAHSNQSEAYKHMLKVITKIIEDLAKREVVAVGLFDYPVLMAADILLYGTEIVPVGEDQKQHVELARDLAKRFNQKFGETFIVPKVFIKEEGMRVMGLDNPEKKMSKSAESIYNRIELLDDAEMIRKKIKKAVTDSGSEIVYSEDKPALKNLINIHSSFSGKSPKEIESMFVGKGYGDFKNELAEIVIAFLTPFQERFNAISDEEVLEILRAGAEKIRPLAKAKLDEVKNKIGFIV
jgi:tryptophanyl-tRNA synthetase